MYALTHFPRMLLSATPLESWSNPLSVDSTSEPGLPRRTISTRLPQHTLPTPIDRLRRRWLTSSRAPRVTCCSSTRQRPPLRDSWNSRYPNGWPRRSGWRRETAASGYCSNNVTSALWKMATHTNTPPQELIQPVLSLGQQVIAFGGQVAGVDAFLAPACRQGRASGTPKFRATSLTFPGLHYVHTPSSEKQTSDKSSHSLMCCVQKKYGKKKMRG